jgi:hypothetical protein
MQFNPFDPAVRQNPYPQYAELRREDPVHRMDSMGFWAVTRYQDVQYVLKNPQLFSSEGMAGPQGLQGGVIRSIITMDPPDHGPFRTLISRAFTPRMISALEPRIREITHSCSPASATRRSSTPSTGSRCRCRSASSPRCWASSRHATTTSSAGRTSWSGC